MRQALWETFADPEFVAEGEKIGLSLNGPRSGEFFLDHTQAVPLARATDRSASLARPARSNSAF